MSRHDLTTLRTAIEADCPRRPPSLSGGRGSRFGRPTLAELAAAALLIAAAASAQAAAVTYTVASLGGQTWQYSYVVANDGAPTTINEFTIYFDWSLVGNLQLLGSPAGWDFALIQPDAALPDDGFVDGLALAGGLDPGGALSGLLVSFTYSGAGTPGSQRFEVVDPVTLAVLASGMTRPEAGALPEPSTPWLIGIAGWIGAALGRRKRIPGEANLQHQLSGAPRAEGRSHVPSQPEHPHR